MQKSKLLDRVEIESGASGEEETVRVVQVISALSAKTAAVYLQIHDDDGDTETRIKVGAQHTSDPTAGFAEFGTAFYDSGDSTGVGNGFYSGGGIDVSGVDQLLLVPSIQKISAGSGQKRAVISLWLILKPF